MTTTSKWGNLSHRYETQQPRKILSIDGGGIRGVIALQKLLQIELQLKESLGKGSDFRLGHYFDYIAGNSTGAIIAAGLSLGLSVEQLVTFYEDKGEAMFDKAFLAKRYRYFYEDGPLLAQLKEVFGEGDIDLRSGKFCCLLMVVTMNRSTDSPWPITNNPNAKYNALERADCNLRIPLYQLVRASTAAPMYFKAETLNWDTNDPSKKFVFVDGGVTPYNNPAFLAYRMATQHPYGLNWKTGEKDLLIVSVGTGASASPGTYDHLLELTNLPNNLMYAMQVDQDINCRSVGRCVHGAAIDRELGDMVPLDQQGNMLALDSDASRHFRYVRYETDLSTEGLKALGMADANPDHIRSMTGTKHINLMKQAGAASAVQVDVKKHFKYFI